MRVIERDEEHTRRKCMECGAEHTIVFVGAVIWHRGDGEYVFAQGEEDDLFDALEHIGKVVRPGVLICGPKLVYKSEEAVR